MGDKQREFCRSGLHEMSGNNIGRHHSARYCKACAKIRNRKNSVKSRKRLIALGGRFGHGGKVIYPPGYVKRDPVKRAVIDAHRMDTAALEWIERMDREYHPINNVRFGSSLLAFQDPIQINRRVPPSLEESL